MKIMNKKGFTLVELLAVIVVLAIIMIIAVPSVMESMNSARKNAFKIYAQKVLNTAQTKHQASVLTGTNTATYCKSLTDLMGSSVGNYQGYVVVCNGTSDSTIYRLWLTDKNYSYTKKQYSELTDPAAASTGITNTCPTGTNLTNACS